MKITSYINRGNSFPVILEDGGEKYFVKLHAGMSGKYALLSEYLGNKLGNQLNLKTQIPLWIELDQEVEIEEIHIEVKDLINKSLGTNIGFKYQEEATALNGKEWKEGHKKEAQETYLFDLMMINIDRTPQNMNLMKVGEDTISVDYESSLLLQELIGNKNLLADARILQGLRNNPLYQEISETLIDEFLEKTKKISIKEILAEIPSKLLGKEERDSILKGMETKQKNKWFLKETLAKLKNLHTETKAEQKSRSKRNQAAFKRLVLRLPK